MLVDDTVALAEAEISSALEQRGGSKPKFAEFDQVFAHYLNDRDAFLTWDKALLAAADLFHQDLDVRIVKPEDIITRIDDWPAFEPC